jgi:hypothetical protein
VALPSKLALLAGSRSIREVTDLSTPSLQKSNATIMELRTTLT